MNKILFIQGQFTQFDSPFYNILTENANISVIYTNMKFNISYDLEIGTNVVWSNIAMHNYNFYITKNIFKIIKIILSRKPDLIVISGWFPPLHFFLSVILKLLNFDLALRSDKIFDIRDSQFKLSIYRQYFKYFKYLMPVGNQASNFFQKVIPNAKNKIIIYPYCVDTEWINKLSLNFYEEKNQIIKSLGFSHNDIIIVSAIKFNEREDPLTLINSFLRIRLDNKNYKLILIGDGPLKVKINNIIHNLSDNDKLSIYLPGYVNYELLIKFFSISNLFIHPAHYEPFGVSVQEALICGLYTIVSNQVGSRFDFIKPKNNGDIFIAGNELDLYNKIKFWELNNNHKTILPISEIRKSGNYYNYYQTIENFKKLLT
jgi:glycosyltransferase involved in cell wall biosynthesis